MIKNQNRPSVIIYTYISIAIILWGFSFIWTNQLIKVNTPIFTFIFFRMLIAGLLLLLFSFIFKKLQRVDKIDYKFFILMSLFEPFIYFIGESFGIKATNSPTLSSVIIASIPVFTLVSGQIFFKEKISIWNIFGVVITIPGIILMVFNKGNFTPEYWWGILLLFVAVFSAVGYTTTVKKLASKYNSYTISTYQFLIGALLFLPLFLIFNANSFDMSFFRKEVLIPLLSLSVLCSSFAFILYIESIKVLGVTRAAIFTSLIPAFSALGAYLYGQESFSAIQLSGMAIVMFGVILTQKS